MFALVVAASGSPDAHFAGRLVALGFATLSAYVAVNAVRKGRITPTRADRAYARADEPVAFWFHVAAYAVVAFAFALGAAVRPRLMLLGFGTLLAYFALNAIGTGKLKPSIHDRVYTRSNDPGTFWFHILVETVVAAALLAAGVLSA
jgi:hypothetical protein